ncbi:Alpha-ketoglutarate-dependent 2,4-dichlorophenoxyacetate dioxygenase [Pseudocercospora fuligena]|uniref:Alpha-ketoglutarate-dependent 2,4-dichlorophenoxyacetate dioxygenase n=1 Tax=Pseudocercospora fuligena TaxID=685502 RepID=A0A8H6RFE2_9PEZI|nr:Alpha-ketoglutarate-dependent 2,4-dichlorophenoxyacetate dioxygenase [Pseudocercospora fuligena]
MGSIGQANLTFTRLHPTFGVEVTGVDFSQPLSPNVIEGIKEAINREGVLVFRKANLDNDQHIAFSKQLGDPDLYDVSAHIKAGRVMRFPEQPEIFDVSNLDNNGKIVTDADPARKEGNKGNFLWHADMVYNPRRALYSLLRAVQLPPPGSGGETQYLDSRTAFEDLPQDIKDEIEPLITNNSLMHNRKLGSPEFFKHIEPLDQPMARFKLVSPHVGSGRKNLYLTTYAHHIDGKSWEESKVLFDKLWEHLTQEKYILTVHWKDNGDMVMWDNTAVLHRATSTGSYSEKYVRDMRRTTTKDNGNYSWGENDPNDPWEAGISQKRP